MTAATIPQVKRRSGAWLLWLVLVLLAGLALIELPPINGHATERHGRTAWSAWTYVANYDPNDKGDGDDDKLFDGETVEGHRYIILRLKRLAGKPTTWAVVVLLLGCSKPILKTCYLTQSRKQVARLKERCKEER